MLWLWITLVAAQAGPVDCERIGWRAQTASAAHAAQATDAGELKPALKNLASTSRREDPSCQAPPPSGACADAGIELANRVGEYAVALDEAHDQSAQHEAVGTLLERRRKAGSIPPEDAGKLEQRLQAEEASLEIHARWLAAQTAWNAGRCEGACAGGPACEAHKGSQRTLDTLRTLYTDLLRARRDFFTRFDLASLQARIEAGGAQGPRKDVAPARAALLQAQLASSAARPVKAQTTLGSVLAAYDGAPELGPDARRTAVAWLAYDRSWRRYLDGVDEQIDAVIDAWKRLDEVEGTAAGTAAMSRLRMAMDAIRDRGPATPAGPRGL